MRESERERERERERVRERESEREREIILVLVLLVFLVTVREYTFFNSQIISNQNKVLHTSPVMLFDVFCLLFPLCSHFPLILCQSSPSSSVLKTVLAPPPPPSTSPSVISTYNGPEQSHKNVSIF